MPARELIVAPGNEDQAQAWESTRDAARAANRRQEGWHMPDENKELARRFIAVFDTGDTAELDDFVADDVTDHNPLPGTGTGRQGIADAVAVYRRAFPDLAVTVDRLMAEDECVVATGTATGTNTGELRGAPPTGRQATFAYMDMYRIADRRIVECWHLEDVAGMLGQLGLLPR